MSAIAPPAILDDNAALKKRADRPKSYRFSGSAGDARHLRNGGYHVDPDDLRSSDYSIALTRDKHGAHLHPKWASAWDLTFNPHDMVLVTNRLLAAAKAHDPRMAGVREFCGTRNGTQTYPWDLHTNSSEGINSWDSSHLWHVHISFYRDASTAQVAAVLDVICGVKMTLPQKVKAGGSKAKAKVTKPRFALPAGHYYGLISGPAQSHGGFYAGERPAVRLIQQRLQKLGYAPKASTWADGRYEKPTALAVQRWQHAKHRPVTGRITAADWKALI